MYIHTGNEYTYSYNEKNPEVVKRVRVQDLGAKKNNDPVSIYKVGSLEAWQRVDKKGGNIFLSNVPCPYQELLQKRKQEKYARRPSVPDHKENAQKVLQELQKRGVLNCRRQMQTTVEQIDALVKKRTENNWETAYAVRKAKKLSLKQCRKQYAKNKKKFLKLLETNPEVTVDQIMTATTDFTTKIKAMLPEIQAFCSKTVDAAPDPEQPKETSTHGFWDDFEHEHDLSLVHVSPEEFIDYETFVAKLSRVFNDNVDDMRRKVDHIVQTIIYTSKYDLGVSASEMSVPGKTALVLLKLSQDYDTPATVYDFINQHEQERPTLGTDSHTVNVNGFETVFTQEYAASPCDILISTRKYMYINGSVEQLTPAAPLVMRRTDETTKNIVQRQDLDEIKRVIQSSSSEKDIAVSELTTLESKLADEDIDFSMNDILLVDGTYFEMKPRLYYKVFNGVKVQHKKEIVFTHDDKPILELSVSDKPLNNPGARCYVDDYNNIHVDVSSNMTKISPQSQTNMLTLMRRIYIQECNERRGNNCEQFNSEAETMAWYRKFLGKKTAAVAAFAIATAAGMYWRPETISAIATSVVPYFRSKVATDAEPADADKMKGIALGIGAAVAGLLVYHTKDELKKWLEDMFAPYYEEGKTTLEIVIECIRILNFTRDACCKLTNEAIFHINGWLVHGDEEIHRDAYKQIARNEADENSQTFAMMVMSHSVKSVLSDEELLSRICETAIQSFSTILLGGSRLVNNAILKANMNLVGQAGTATNVGGEAAQQALSGFGHIMNGIAPFIVKAMKNYIKSMAWSYKVSNTTTALHSLMRDWSMCGELKQNLTIMFDMLSYHALLGDSIPPTLDDIPLVGAIWKYVRKTFLDHYKPAFPFYECKFLRVHVKNTEVVEDILYQLKHEQGKLVYQFAYASDKYKEDLETCIKHSQLQTSDSIIDTSIKKRGSISHKGVVYKIYKTEKNIPETDPLLTEVGSLKNKKGNAIRILSPQYEDACLVIYAACIGNITLKDTENIKLLDGYGLPYSKRYVEVQLRQEGIKMRYFFALCKALFGDMWADAKFYSSVDTDELMKPYIQYLYESSKGYATEFQNMLDVFGVVQWIQSAFENGGAKFTILSNTCAKAWDHKNFVTCIMHNEIHKLKSLTEKCKQINDFDRQMALQGFIDAVTAIYNEMPKTVLSQTSERGRILLEYAQAIATMEGKTLDIGNIGKICTNPIVLAYTDSPTIRLTKVERDTHYNAGNQINFSDTAFQFSNGLKIDDDINDTLQNWRDDQGIDKSVLYFLLQDSSMNNILDTQNIERFATAIQTILDRFSTVSDQTISIRIEANDVNLVNSTYFYTLLDTAVRFLWSATTDYKHLLPFRRLQSYVLLPSHGWNVKNKTMDPCCLPTNCIDWTDAAMINEGEALLTCGVYAPYIHEQYWVRLRIQDDEYSLKLLHMIERDITQLLTKYRASVLKNIELLKRSGKKISREQRKDILQKVLEELEWSKVEVVQCLINAGDRQENDEKTLQIILPLIIDLIKEMPDKKEGIFIESGLQSSNKESFFKLTRKWKLFDFNEISNPGNETDDDNMKNIMNPKVILETFQKYKNVEETIVRIPEYNESQIPKLKNVIIGLALANKYICFKNATEKPPKLHSDYTNHSLGRYVGYVTTSQTLAYYVDDNATRTYVTAEYVNKMFGKRKRFQELEADWETKIKGLQDPAEKDEL